MAREIPGPLLAALSQRSCRPYYAIEMLFDTAPLRFWTGLGERIIAGHTYTGAGAVLSIGEVNEAGDLSAQSTTHKLSGISLDIIALALAEPYQGRPCRVMFGEVSVADVSIISNGSMNTMTIEDNDETCTILLLVDSMLVKLQRAVERRYTHESQQQRYPGDTFFSFVADLQDKSFAWGRSG